MLLLNDTVQHLVHYHEPENDILILKDCSSPLKDSFALSNKHDVKSIYNKTEQHINHKSIVKRKTLQIIEVTEDYLVINKPHVIACHSTGDYNNYTITNTFKKYGNLSCINRLDVVTTGVLILAFKNARKYHEMMMSREVKKIYLARVSGDFNADGQDEVIVDKRIKKNIYNVSTINDEGRTAITHFKKLFYINGESLIECMPVTGRSHQIRVHLKYLGFPMINDSLYNELYNKNKECNLKDAEILNLNEKNSNPSLSLNDEKSTNSKSLSLSNARVTNLDSMPVSLHDRKSVNLGCNTLSFGTPKENFAIRYCRSENTRAFRNKDKFICLHAYEYIFDGKVFISEPPFWCRKETF